MRRRHIVAAMIMMFLASLLLFNNNANAAGEGGAWLGNGEGVPFSGGGGTGGGGGGGTCLTDEMTAQVAFQCTGWSWIYYQYIGETKEDKDNAVIQFTPDADGILRWIGKKGENGEKENNCAKIGSDNEEKGFWHRGQNRNSFSNFGESKTITNMRDVLLFPTMKPLDQ